ncbi:MAG: hypothetical protein LBR56_09695 [Sporomusaceae bacterium]|jgi:[citrate (pro-3S)-lyase] ligase|nr:hypothetical protein [Sporomusaceae bacterium]
MEKQLSKCLLTFQKGRELVVWEPENTELTEIIKKVGGSLSPAKHYLVLLATGDHPEKRHELHKMGFGRYTDYFSWQIEPEWQFLVSHLPLIYTKGYSCSQYFKDIGIKNIAVYCNQADFILGAQVLCDLMLSLDINVKFWLSNKRWTADFPHPVDSLTFDVELIDQLTANDAIFIYCREYFDDSLAKIYTRAKKVYHIADIWPDIWWRAMMTNSLQEIRNLFPFLPVVIYNPAYYPTNKGAYSDMEKYIEQNNLTHYANTILPLLTQPHANIPKTYENLEYNIDEIREMLSREGTSYIDGKQLKLRDYSGTKVNIINGHRIVPEQPQNYKHTIYCFGGCTTFGVGCPDNGTRPAYLQKILNENYSNEFCVENFGTFLGGRQKYLFENIKSIAFKPGDILIIDFIPLIEVTLVDYLPDGVFYLDTAKIFERPHKFGENLFFDRCHSNEHGQFFIASKVFDFLKLHNFFEEYINKPVVSKKASLLPDEELAELDSYLEKIVPLRPQIGSIVVNCNPFTLGHRYLIEYAATKCSRLFIFLVEEDKSEFSFIERLELVRLGTKDMPNITIIPSGRFIISSLTFTDYFGKSQMQEREIDPSLDVEIFGRYIAPKLGINIRFAGDEPFDTVTHQYNATMQKILPQYGVEFEVIPRQEINGTVISASMVRELLKTKNFDDIAKIVPKTTLEYLKQFYK